MTRPILFLSDYGTADEFVGVCRAVVARLAPGVRIIDLVHEVPPQDVARGAALLAEATPYAPEDTVYLAVVDPGVGTPRRAIVVEAGAALLVGPDNGLVRPAADALGGVTRAFEIADPAVMLEPVSATFHGRDVFAPVAARLAAGMPPQRVGPPVDPASLEAVELPGVRVEPGHVHCKVFGIDRFGNIQLSARPSDLGDAGLEGGRIRVRVAGQGHDVVLGRTFGDVEPGDALVLADSAGYLTVGINQGSAAEALALARGDHVVLAAPGAPE